MSVTYLKEELQRNRKTLDEKNIRRNRRLGLDIIREVVRIRTREGFAT